MKRIIEPLIHVVIWLAGFFLVVMGANTIGVFHKSEGSLWLPVIIGTLINVFMFYSVSFVFIPRFSNNRNTKQLVGNLILLFMVGSGIESLIDFFIFSGKFSTANEPFGSQLITNSVFNLIILALALSYGFIKTWIRQERNRQQLKAEKLSAELGFLKAQINPHFLFNVLNMAYSSASANKDEQTATIIQRLANLMRYMLYDSNADQVELDMEIQYIQHYIQLQQQRLPIENQVDISFKINGPTGKTRLAPLLLVPFVENAFKHGIKLENPCHIYLVLTASENKLIFKIQNNILHREEKHPEIGGIGLDNVRKRLELIYPNKHKLIIKQEEDLYIVELELQLN